MTRPTTPTEEGPPGRTGLETIVLIGPMASGKSAVGLALATLMGKDFVDSDHRVVAEHGEIPAIFAAYGEPGFREREAAAIAAALDEEHPAGVVLAVGGGAILRAETRARLVGLPVVYLEVEWEQVEARLRGREDRPLLHGDAEGSWRTLMKLRRPLYEGAATHRVASGTGTPPEVAEQIAALLGERRHERVQGRPGEAQGRRA